MQSISVPTSVILKYDGQVAETTSAPNLFGMRGKLLCFGQAVVPDLHDHGHATVGRFHKCVGDRLPFITRQRDAFARAAADVQPAGATCQQVVDHRADDRRVHIAPVIEWGVGRRNQALQFFLVHSVGSWLFRWISGRGPWIILGISNHRWTVAPTVVAIG